VKRRILAISSGLIAALALAAPAAAEPEPAQVTLNCTSFGALPPGPPEAVGQITVVSASGNVTTPPLVPGPCSAPGFVEPPAP
jgi:hypothetical protein